MRFTITLEPSGHHFESAEGQPLLAAGIGQGIGLPYSCKTGICRTCKGKVLAGRVALGAVTEKYLSSEERAQGFALLCSAQALSDCTIEIQEAPRSFASKTLPARVSAIRRPAADVAVVQLRLPMNQKLLLMPGQYVEILLPSGERRSYSVANAPGPEGIGEIELHIRKVSGGTFTTHVFETMKERDMVRFEGPFGSFYLREGDRPIVMLASGTGFAPVKAMVEAMIRRRVESGSGQDRPVHLYWGGRRRADLYFADQAQGWADANPMIHFVPVLSEPSAQCSWSGRAGLVHEAVMEDHPDLSGFEVYACGAPGMVNAARRDFVERRGLPETQFFADSFFTTADRLAAPGRE